MSVLRSEMVQDLVVMRQETMLLRSLAAKKHSILARIDTTKFQSSTKACPIYEAIVTF